MKQTEEGFTLVEVMIALAVGVILLLSAYQMFSSISSLGRVAQQYAIADNLAYSYLRKYAYQGVAGDTLYTCNMSGNDIINNARGPGFELDSGGPLTGTGLPGIVTYEIRSWAKFGCSTAQTRGSPILLQVTVKYGDGRMVTHSTLAGKR